MVKIFISSGHDAYDPGAVSSKSGKKICERDEVWKIANMVAEELNNNYDCKAYREGWEDGWRDTVRKCNNLNCDFFFEFHENAGGGDGAECIIHNTDNKPMAVEISKAFKEVGQQWRRIIVDPTYWVLRDTNCKAMIVECAFTDSKDILDWDEDSEKRKLAKSLAKHIAIIGHAKPKQKKKKPPVKKKIQYNYYCDYITNMGMNFRTKPDADDKYIITVIPKNTRLKGTINDGWLKTTYKGRKGYVKVHKG